MITSDDGLPAYRELDDAFGLTDIAIAKLRRERPDRLAASSSRMGASRLRGRRVMPTARPKTRCRAPESAGSTNGSCNSALDADLLDVIAIGSCGLRIVLEDQRRDVPLTSSPSDPATATSGLRPGQVPSQRPAVLAPRTSCAISALLRSAWLAPQGRPIPSRCRRPTMSGRPISPRRAPLPTRLRGRQAVSPARVLRAVPGMRPRLAGTHGD